MYVRACQVHAFIIHTTVCVRVHTVYAYQTTQTAPEINQSYAMYTTYYAVATHRTTAAAAHTYTAPSNDDDGSI